MSSRMRLAKATGSRGDRNPYVTTKKVVVAPSHRGAAGWIALTPGVGAFQAIVLGMSAWVGIALTSADLIAHDGFGLLLSGLLTSVPGVFGGAWHGLRASVNRRHRAQRITHAQLQDYSAHQLDDAQEIAARAWWHATQTDGAQDPDQVADSVQADLWLLACLLRDRDALKEDLAEVDTGSPADKGEFINVRRALAAAQARIETIRASLLSLERANEALARSVDQRRILLARRTGDLAAVVARYDYTSQTASLTQAAQERDADIRALL